MKKATKVKKRRAKRKTTTDAEVRRKYARGDKIEAYTMGEALGSKKWP